MGLLLFAILGGMFFAFKRAKGKKRQSKQQESREIVPAGPPDKQYRDSPPDYEVKHQPWCDRTCDGRCKENVQYTPATTPRGNPGREDYFNAIQDDRSYHGVMSEKGGQKM